MHIIKREREMIVEALEPLTPSTVKRRVIKKRRGRWPIQHLVAIRKNCSWAI